MHVQAFRAELAIQGLDIGVIRYDEPGAVVSRTDLMDYAEIIRVTGHREHASAGKAVILT